MIEVCKWTSQERSRCLTAQGLNLNALFTRRSDKATRTRCNNSAWRHSSPSPPTDDDKSHHEWNEEKKEICLKLMNVLMTQKSLLWVETEMEIKRREPCDTFTQVFYDVVIVVVFACHRLELQPCQPISSVITSCISSSWMLKSSVLLEMWLTHTHMHNKRHNGA